MTQSRSWFRRQQHWQGKRDSRTAPQPSFTIRGTRAKAATGSAQDFPHSAFATKPIKAIQAMYPHRPDCAASALRAALEVTAANCRFRLASHGITTPAATKIPIPTRLRCASRYPRKFKTEVSVTRPASAKSKTPAIRAARDSMRPNRKRHNTTAAERSSIKLSPPKANRAGLCEVQAVPSETTASTVIQIMVRT